MKTSWKLPVLLVLLVPLLAACGGEEKPQTCRGALDLDGIWFGAMEDDMGSLFTLEWHVCDDRVVAQWLSGLDHGAGGRLRPEAPGVYRVRFNDGTTARLLADAHHRYVVVVSEFFDFAVLQRGASALPRYRWSDLDGVWLGEQFTRTHGLTAIAGSRADCVSGYCATLQGDGGSALMDLPYVERDFGLWWGSYADSWESGIAGALMSPDREFLGTYSCPSGYAAPWDCRFGAYLRR